MDRRNGKFSGRGKNPYVDRRESKSELRAGKDALAGQY